MNSKLNMLDQAETHFINHEFSPGADLVRNACFQALAEAASTLGIPCASNSEAWTAAEKLDQIRPHPNPHISYSLSILHAGTYVKSAATHHNPTSRQWEPHEYIEGLYDKRIIIASIEAIAQETANHDKFPIPA